MTEFLPSKYRAYLLIFSSLFWSFGTFFQMSLVIIIVPAWGWRLYLIMCAMPLFIFLSLSFCLPESARFHLANDCHEKALQVLKKISIDNKIDLPEGDLAVVKVILR